jgi:uncharacterized membrane protein
LGEQAKNHAWLNFLEAVILWITIVSGFIIAVLIILYFIKKYLSAETKKTKEAVDEAKGEVIKEVQAVPVNTAGIVDLQKSFPLKDVGKHNPRNVMIHPMVIDGKVRTLQITATAANKDYDDIADVPRIPAKKGQIKGTNADVLRMYYDGELDGASPHLRLQKAVVKKAIKDSEVEEL